MNIDVYTLCYNEEVLLPYFIRHYERFARRIVIYDNNSTDNSVRLASQHSRCSVIPFDKVGRDELTKIKNECWRDSDADWVIVCDMDEFMHYPNLYYLFQQVTGRYSVLKPHTYTMVTTELPSCVGQIWWTYNEGVRSPEHDKCLCFAPSLINSMNFTNNGLDCSPEPESLIFNNPELRLLHYRCLGFDYTINRFAALRDRIGKEIDAKHLCQKTYIRRKVCVNYTSLPMMHLKWEAE